MDMGQQTDTSDDKRKVERKYLVFYLRVFEGKENRVLGHVANISSRGIMLLSDNPIPVGEEYPLRMRLPSLAGERNEIVFEAISRWSKKDSNPDFYLTGFEISRLSVSEEKENLQLLEEFSFVE